MNSFTLNMSYLIDQCDHWLGTAPAGPGISAGFRQYQRGLSLVRKGAAQLESAALYNDTAHQKALNRGNDAQEREAGPEERYAKMEALRRRAGGLGAGDDEGAFAPPGRRGRDRNESTGGV